MWAYIKDGAIKQTNILQTKLEINPGSYFLLNMLMSRQKIKKKHTVFMK